MMVMQHRCNYQRRYKKTNKKTSHDDDDDDGGGALTGLQRNETKGVNMTATARSNYLCRLPSFQSCVE